MTLGKHPIDKQEKLEQVESELNQGAHNMRHGSIQSTTSASRANLVDSSEFTKIPFSDDSNLSLTSFYAYALYDAQSSESGPNLMVRYAIGVLVVLVIVGGVILQRYFF